MEMPEGEWGEEDDRDLTSRSSTSSQLSQGSSQTQVHGHGRSPSLTSPPPPPPDFNPPADVSGCSVESTLHAITPPASQSSSQVSSQIPSHASSQPASSAASPTFEADRLLQPSLLAQAAEMARPGLHALQRVSNESMGGTSNSSRSSVPSAQSYASGGAVTIGSGSEGGEHLAEMREKLLVDAGSGPSWSRSDSGGEASFDVNVISPTPPLRPAPSPLESNAEAGPSRRRGSGKSSSPVLPELPAEHAWDSVWPHPGAITRGVSNVSIPEAGPSRFPTAPVSPFITPSFSPAVIQTTAPRRPTSPRSSSPSRRSTSPSRSNFSPRVGNSPTLEPWQPPDTILNRRRSSVTAAIAEPPILPHSPTGTTPVAIGNKHTRSFSNSSANSLSGTSPTHRSFAQSIDRLQKQSPPASPPRSPRSPRRTAVQPTVQVSPSDRPASPMVAGSKWQRKSGQRSPPSNGLLNAGNRPRGKSVSGAKSPLSAEVETVSPPPLLPSSSFSPRLSAKGYSSAPTAAALPADIPATIPPVALPPAVTSSPVASSAQTAMLGMDDGLIRIPPKVPSPPLFAPLARPAALRRALSDYDARARQMPTPPGLPRSSSLESEDQPKQTPAYPDLHSPMHPSPLAELRGKKSPRLAATIEPMTIPPLDSEAIDRRRPRPAPLTIEHETRPVGVFPDHVGEVELVDEGDVLPPDIDLTMDVTFEDEGLNTLERIFLLSKSEFPFHRAYIARVLGDLLYDVDPCESVEYVLPLISSFTLDEDESVKEAFAADLHRMLWYFFSMCRVIPAGEEPTAPFTTGEDETVTITSEGVNVVHRPSEGEIEHRSRADSGSGAGSGSGSSGSSGSKSAHDEVDSANESPYGRRKSVASLGGSLGGGGPSSGGSSFTRPGSSTFSVPEHDVDTPDSIVSSSSQDTVFSPSTHVDPYTDTDPEKGWTKDVGPLVQQPTLPVDFFTPLLGALLLNANTDIQDSVRTGIVTLIGRLRGKGDLSAERWGQYAAEADERRVFASQNGPHSHDLRPMSTLQREMVEKELLQGIVVGMGRLSTEMPDHLFSDTLEENQRTLEMYADSLSEELSADIAQAHRDRDAFQAQLIQEATAGRATSMNLIGALCEFYDGVEVVQRGFVDEVLRSGDGDVPVRAEGAVALSYIAKIVPVEHVYRMIPLFEQLADDEYPQVRQSACLSLPAICRRIESPDYRRTFATKALRTLTADSPEADDDVRCAALEVLGELIYVFHDDPRGPPAELLVAYLDADGVGKGLGEDWDVVASFNLPGVVLTLGPDRWHELRDLYLRLNDSPNPKVRRTLAASLHELSKILREDQVAQDLMPVYTRCLAEDDEIRELIFEHVEIFLCNLPLELGWSSFLDLCKAWSDGTLGGWRARERLALHIPALFQCFGEVDGVESVLEMMRDALLDPFAAVRDAATKGIPTSYEVLGQDSEIAKKFRETLLDLGASSVFRQRLTFVRCLREFVKPPPNRSAFEDFFLPALPRLSQDVVDVRLGLAQIVADLFVVGAFYSDQMHVPSGIIQIAKDLAVDDAVDVRDTVRRVDLARLGKGDGVPFEVKPFEPPKRAVTPSQVDPLHPDNQSSEKLHPDIAEQTRGSPSPSAGDVADLSASSTAHQSPQPQSVLGGGGGIKASPESLGKGRSGSGGSDKRVPTSPNAGKGKDLAAHFGEMGMGNGMGIKPPLLSPAWRAITGDARSPLTPNHGDQHHWDSSPSPTAIPRGRDPFSESFAAAAPDPSSGSE